MNTADQQTVPTAIGALELLEAIELGDVGWSDRLGAHPLTQLATAVDQQIRAGNLADGLTLTSRGRATLTRLRTQVARRAQPRSTGDG